MKDTAELSRERSVKQPEGGESDLLAAPFQICWNQSWKIVTVAFSG